jgi:hypothetical protein
MEKRNANKGRKNKCIIENNEIEKFKKSSKKVSNFKTINYQRLSALN